MSRELAPGIISETEFGSFMLLEMLDGGIAWKCLNFSTGRVGMWYAVDLCEGELISLVPETIKFKIDKDLTDVIRAALTGKQMVVRKKDNGGKE